MVVDQIKCIALDLDGTLLHPMGKISDDSMRILKTYDERKIKIVICSGRHYREITLLLRECGNINYSYIISCDGQYIHDREGKLVWNNVFLKKLDVNYIQNIYAKAPISFFTDLRDYYIAPTLLTYFKKIVFSNGKECIFYKYNKCPDDAEIEKIVLNLKMSEYHKKKLSKKYTIHEINNEKVELLEKNVNKYTALLKCSHYLEIDTDEILYFGDDLNDVEVFDNLSHCVAMGNAAEQIKKRAAYITKTNKEDGVAFFLTSVLNKYID